MYIVPSKLPTGHPKVTFGKVGVLLVNLGTPQAPEARSVRVYLKQFLSDPRVIEIPRLVWQPSDADDDALASIAAWREHSGLANLLPALEIDGSKT